MLSLPAQLTPEWISKNHSHYTSQLKHSDLILDCRQLEHLSSLGLAFFTELQKIADQKEKKFILSGTQERVKSELSKAPKTIITGDQLYTSSPSPFYQIGDALVKVTASMKVILHLLTESLYWSSFGIGKKKSILPGSTTAQMIVLGSSALPIVLLLSFLIGLTLAIQSAVQLEKFGASLYIASGIGISMVTEIGPMMTAVILAGRSGSSITAEISTMVVQEELRALKTMAINPIHFLLLPRFWALSITLPLLTICADIIGIIAGLIVAVFYAGVPAELFFNELQNAVTATMIIQSLIKAVTFAWIITLVSVYKGFNAHGGADAVGKATTSCVVTCLFSIIMADAIFSFIFYF